MMTDEQIREFEDQNWSRVPEADRARCVEHLRRWIKGPDEWREAMEEPGFHMFSGMRVRNALRDMLKDDELPAVDYPDGHAYRNWDDFYMAALREALSLSI